MVDLLLQVITFVAIRVLLQHKDWEARMAGDFNAAPEDSLNLLVTDSLSRYNSPAGSRTKIKLLLTRIIEP
jgi:hypothetical protein